MADAFEDRTLVHVLKNGSSVFLYHMRANGTCWGWEFHAQPQEEGGFVEKRVVDIASNLDILEEAKKRHVTCSNASLPMCTIN